MIHLEYVDRAHSTQTVPVVCMHCDSPTCAEVCPADAIKKTEDGVVQTARKPRCIACNNCVLACPFGVPKMMADFELMMKCDMCYDRTSDRQEADVRHRLSQRRPVLRHPPGGRAAAAAQQPINRFQFGRQTLTTKVSLMAPRAARAAVRGCHRRVGRVGFRPTHRPRPLTGHGFRTRRPCRDCANDEPRTTAPDGRDPSEQPAWRHDFPIDWPQDHYVARRDFVKFLGLTSLAFVVGQVWIGLKSLLRRPSVPETRVIARSEEVSPGGSLVFRYPEEHDLCILVRRHDGTLLAYDQKCTHLSCAVIPDVQAGRLLCPCHKGVFDLATGRPLAGPPRRPLPRIRVEERDGAIYATAIEEEQS